MTRRSGQKPLSPSRWAYAHPARDAPNTERAVDHGLPRPGRATAEIVTRIRRLTMPAGKALKREMRVAFSGRAQPVWFRVLKWAIAVGVSVLVWRTEYFWLWMLGAPGLALTVHLIWRYLAVENQGLDGALGRLGRSRGSQQGLGARRGCRSGTKFLSGLDA